MVTKGYVTDLVDMAVVRLRFCALDTSSTFKTRYRTHVSIIPHREVLFRVSMLLSIVTSSMMTASTLPCFLRRGGALGDELRISAPCTITAAVFAQNLLFRTL